MGRPAASWARYPASTSRRIALRSTFRSKAPDGGPSRPSQLRPSPSHPTGRSPPTWSPADWTPTPRSTVPRSSPTVTRLPPRRDRPESPRTWRRRQSSSAIAIRPALRFSLPGYTWAVKDAPYPVGPGSNVFSTRPDDIWADAQGLHLSIHQHDDSWWSTEAILTESLGYGTYVFQTTQPGSTPLDANATFGSFTWDPYGDGTSPGGGPNREFNVETSRWGDPLDPLDAQFVVQPWDTAGHRQRFTLPDLSGDSAVTWFVRWAPESIEYAAVRGSYTSGRLSGRRRDPAVGVPGRCPASGARDVPFQSLAELARTGRRPALGRARQRLPLPRPCNRRRPRPRPFSG